MLQIKYLNFTLKHIYIYIYDRMTIHNIKNNVNFKMNNSARINNKKNPYVIP